MPKKKSYDVFISHASEDKAAFVEPLANELRKRGLNVWYDKFELKVGDSLRESIERGLSTARYGIVVFSPSFFKKRWPRKELNGLFSREMSGNKKRILPILHNTSIAEIRKRFPIQSDRVFLLSSMSLGDLCESLISEIKPSYLKLDTLRARTFDLSESLIDQARKDYPGYDFGVSTNSSQNKGKKQIEIRIVDPAAVTSPPAVNITFIGEGARKADEFARTGKPQRWVTGEFTSVTSKFPFFREMTEGEITVAPASAPSRPVSLKCGAGEFPSMYMKLLRRGIEEAEVEISSDIEPLALKLVFNFSGKGTVDINFSWQLGNARARSVSALMKFIDGLVDRADLQITDLTGNIPALRVPIAKSARIPDPFDQGARNVIRVSAQIEERFSQILMITMNTSDEDRQSLMIFDSLLNGRDLDVAITKTVVIKKGDNPQLDEAIVSGAELPSRFFAPVEGFSGFLPLFGKEVRIPPWGLAAECKVIITDEERKAYAAQPFGNELTLKISNDGKGTYQWASEFQTPEKIPARTRRKR